MRKYIEVGKIYLKAQFMWRADAIFNMFFTISRIIFAYLLWGIIFEGKDTVGSFTFSSMLSYYIISSFLTQIEMSSGISGEISMRIRNGTFSKYMVLPISIFKYFLAMEIGVVLFYVGFNFLAAIVWVVIFQIDFVITSNILLILCAFVMIILGLFFMVQLNYFLGLLTLKFQEISTFLMIKDNLMSMLTGSIIPLALFPDIMIQIMRVTPFYYITYLPSMLLIGQNRKEAILGIGVLSVWCLIFAILNKGTYKKYRVKFDGVGI